MMATMELNTLRHRKVHSDSSDHAPQSTLTSTAVDLSPSFPPTFSSISILSDSYIPAPPIPNLEYKSYSVHNLDFQNITLHADQNSPALYTIINSTFTCGIPSVSLHLGARTTPAIGAAHIPAWSGINTFGVRTPSNTAVDGMVWEELRRTTTWTHATYAFEWTWGDGERRKYEWRRTSPPLLDDQSDLHLVELGREEVALAKYRRGAFFRWTVRARLDVRVIEDENEEEWERWETVVLLTVMTVVEMARRRARQRRKM